jgi:chromosome segregation ATPase
MLQREVVRFRAAENQPNPLEVDYWIDITANRYGGIIKYYRNDTLTWEVIEPNPELLKQMIAELKKWVESEVSRLENDLWLNINNVNSRIDDL